MINWFKVIVFSKIRPHKIGGGYFYPGKMKIPFAPSGRFLEFHPSLVLAQWYYPDNRLN